MFRCLGRLGCLLVLVLGAVAGWYTRDSWYPQVRARFGFAAPAAKPRAEKWEPLTAEGAARARLAVGRLSERSGPVYVDLSAADLAAYVLDAALRDLKYDSTGAEAAVRDDRLYVRARVDVGSLVDGRSLGPLGAVVGGKQEITVGGRLEVVAPGRAEFLVDQIAVKDLQLPRPIIEQIVSRIQAKDRTAATPANGIPLRVPRDLADLRVARGAVVLYKSVP